MDKELFITIISENQYYLVLLSGKTFSNKIN